MKLEFVGLLLLYIPYLASAVAIKNLDSRTVASPKPKCDTQKVFDQNTSNNRKQGTCRAFRSTAVNDLENCKPFCGDLATSKDGKMHSCSCLSFGENLPTYCDPHGVVYTMGVCKFDLPLANMIVNDVMTALPLIAKIGCTILFSALKTVVKTVSWVIPGAKALEGMDAGMQAAVKAAKGISEAGKKGQDGVAFFKKDWIGDICGGADEHTAAIEKIFSNLDPVGAVTNAVTDAVAKSKPADPKPT